jgi:high-affinity K+ transport system ATPase subunit B
MGAGIVPRLMAAGHSVTGWNRSKAKAEPLIASGMRYAPTPRAAAAGADVTSSRVSEWMTPDPITTEPNVDADEAIEIMMSHGFRHLPVLEDGKLAGIVSLRDLVRTQIRRANTRRP